MKQIQMNQSKNLSVDDAYDLFIRKCRVKNLSQASIVSYENKIQPFVDYCEGGLIGAVTIDTVDGFTNHLTTYQLTYVVTNNGNVVDNPSITYSSSDETVATVSDTGLMTLLKEGTVEITANSCVTTITVVNTGSGSDVNYTMSISASTDTIKIGGSYKSLSCLFTDKDGQDITETTIADR